MYVDDIFGICRRRDLAHDMGIAKEVCETILGNDSMEPKKTETGDRLTVIGYDIDIEKGFVAVARKNILKALHGFLSTNVHSAITVKALQRLASWASRYSQICRYMAPFTRALYSAYAGRTIKNGFPIPAAAGINILLFRVLLSLTAVKEQDP